MKQKCRKSKQKKNDKNDLYVFWEGEVAGIVYFYVITQNKKDGIQETAEPTPGAPPSNPVHGVMFLVSWSAQARMVC